MPAPINPPPITTNSSIFLDITLEDEKWRNPTVNQKVITSSVSRGITAKGDQSHIHLYNLSFLLTFSDIISWLKQKGSHFNVVTYVRKF